MKQLGCDVTSYDFFDLDQIAGGSTSAVEAKDILSKWIEIKDRSVAQRIYTVLRAWVWKALRDRRGDDELRQWYTLIRNTSDNLKRQKLAIYQERLVTLYELIDESITVSETLTPAELLKRAHVAEILRSMRRSSDYTVSKSTLMDELRLEQSNLTRVLNLLQSGSLIERDRVGRSAHFRLTAEGVTVATQLLDEVKARPIADLKSAFDASVGAIVNKYLTSEFDRHLLLSLPKSPEKDALSASVLSAVRRIIDAEKEETAGYSNTSVSTVTMKGESTLKARPDAIVVYQSKFQNRG